MKNILLGILLLASVAQAQAQERFFKLINGFVSTSVLQSDTSYSLLGIDYDTHSRNVYQYNDIALNGQVNSSWQFEFDTLARCEVAINSTNFDTLNNIVAIVGTSNIVSQNPEGTLLLLKKNLRDTIRSYRYDWGNTTMLTGVKIVDNNTTILLGGQQDNNNIVRTILASIDSLGAIHWIKTFSPSVKSNNRFLKPISLITCQDGGYLITCHDAYYNISGDIQRPVLIKTDSLGVQQWRRYVGDANYLCEGGYAVASPEGGWLVAWSAPYDIAGDANREDGIHIEKLRPNGSTAWSKHLGWVMDYQTDQYNYFPKQFQALPDGNYLVSGYMFSKAFLLKVSPSGDPIWYRVYADPYGVNNNVIDEVLIYSTTPTSDGGFICAGEYRSDPGGLFPNFIQSAFAMKLDEYGCLEPGCQVLDAVEEVDINTAATISVSPNPSTGLYYINQSSDAPLLVYDINGQLLQHYAPHTAQIDLNHLAAGLYILSIGTDKQRLLKL